MLDRDPKKLDQRLLMAWGTLRAVMWLLGHPVFLVEGYRPQSRQDSLFNRGISPVRYSYHTAGEAIDVAFEGRIDPYSPDHPWDLLGYIARQLGLIWGGDWESRDATHIQLSD